MITLNPRDGRPIYEQIQDNFRRLITSGALATGQKLPSVRQLASSLSINPNTIQRAYAQLEAEGFLVSYPGKGSFVAGAKDAGAARKAQLLARLTETAQELLDLGVEKRQLADTLNQLTPQEGKTE